MIILSQTTDILEVVLGGAVTTNQLRCVASWRDITTSSFVPDRTVIVTNGATPVNAVGGPAASTQRVVDLLNIYNLDTVAQTVTVQFNANGTRYVLISASLAAGESLQYVEGNGWVHLTAAGAVTGVSSIAGTANEITASAATGAVTLSLPAALTFTGKTVTNGTFNSPTLVTPALGTPASGNLVNCTGYVGTSALVTVGTLTSGSIGSGFGSINVGTNPITGGAGSFTTLSASASTASTSTTTGALVVTGGVGIGGALNAGGIIGALGTNGTFRIQNTNGQQGQWAWLSASQTVFDYQTELDMRYSNGAGSVATVGAWTSAGLAVTGVVDINGTAASATAGHLNLGSGTQTTIGANGAASALTANPLGYLKAFIGTTAIIIPYYNA